MSELSIDQAAFEKAVIEVGAKKEVNGILMFSPLPKHLNERKIRTLIPVEKDVDCLTTSGAAKVFTDDATGFPPCTPSACMEMLHFYNIPIKGKKCVVVGRSMVVGKPLAIAAVSKAKMLKGNFFKAGQTVIDVGINPDPDNPGKYCGDVDFAQAEPIVTKISPVPGGVGSITTSVLGKHTDGL